MSVRKLPPDEALAAAGAQAAATARAIAAKFVAANQSPTWQDWIISPLSSAEREGRGLGIFVGQQARDAAQALHDINPLGDVSAAAAAAASTADTIVNALKWVGIVVAVIVGALIALWMIVLLTGAKWAIGILGPLAPKIAEGAVRGLK